MICPYLHAAVLLTHPLPLLAVCTFPLSRVNREASPRCYNELRSTLIPREAGLQGEKTGRQNHPALSYYSLSFFGAFLIPGGWYVVVWLILMFSSRWYLIFHLLGVRRHVLSPLLRKH